MIGVFVSKFSPITMGHIEIINKSLSYCDKLVVIVSQNKDTREDLYKNSKLQMVSSEDTVEILEKEFEDENVQVLFLDESGTLPFPEGRNRWRELFYNLLKETGNYEEDITFFTGEDTYESLLDHEIGGEYFFKNWTYCLMGRDKIAEGISATKCRENPEENLTFIHPQCRIWKSVIQERTTDKVIPQDRIDFITDLARDTREFFKLKNPLKSDLISLVKKMTKGSVSCTDTVEISAVEKQEDEFNILINKELYERGKMLNFLVAHELGRLLIHCGYDIVKGKSTGVIVIDRRGMSEMTELECERFALEFMLPVDVFYKLLESHIDNEGMCDFDKVAEKVGLPPVTILHRAEQLGMI